MKLPRVLEPEVMGTPREAEEYDAMDHQEVNRLFVDDLFASGAVAGDILDLGTGTALIPIELSSRDDDCRIMAVDLSVPMLDKARYNIEVAGCRERIELRQLDAKQLPFADGMFDIVMSNSIIHHIAQPLLVLREAVRVARAGGRVFFRDLRRPANENALRRLVEIHAANANDPQRQMFEASLRASLNLVEIRALVEQLNFDGETVQPTSDRHWTWHARVTTDSA
jgi:ubiquinone/menaquinone biosynthesis C-methylase UbiE